MHEQHHPRKRTLQAIPQGLDWLFEDPLGLVPPTPFSSAVFEAWSRCEQTPPDASTLYSLSQACLLDDEHFRARLAEEWRLYSSSPQRPYAGPDRARDPFGLRAAIAGMVADDWDMPPAREPRALLVPAAPLSGSARLLGRAFASIRHERERFARVVLLGDARAVLEEPLVVEPRDHATPLGALRADSAACAALFPAASPWQLAHRGSTTLEPSLLFLRVVFPTLPIVPILVSRHRDARAQALEQLKKLAALAGRSLVLCVADIGNARTDERSRAIDSAHSEALNALDATALNQSGPESCAEALVLFATLLRELDPLVRGNTLGYAPLLDPLEGRAASILFQRED